MQANVQADRETVERELIAAIRECMKASGKECPELTGATVPFKDLEGFDSLCGIEVAVDLEAKLDQALGEDLFVAGSGKSARPRSVGEIADVITKHGKRATKGGQTRHA